MSHDALPPIAGREAEILALVQQRQPAVARQTPLALESIRSVFACAAKEGVVVLISRDKAARVQQQGEAVAAARSRRRNLREKPKALAVPNRGRGPGTGVGVGSDCWAMLSPPLVAA